MLANWFKRHANRWLIGIVSPEPWHLKTLRDGGFLERPEPTNALRQFILSVVEGAVEEARAAETQRRTEEAVLEKEAP